MTRSWGSVPFSTMTTGVAGSAPASRRLRSIVAALRDAHVDGEGLPRCRERVPVEMRRAVFRRARHDGELAHLPAQRQWQRHARGDGMRRRDARDDGHVDAGGTCRSNLLGCTAEDHGIATLEACHALALERFAHQDAVDLVLRRRLAARRLADVDAHGIAPRIVEDGRVHEPVMHEHVGILQRLQRLQRQEIGIAGPAADQHDAAVATFAGVAQRARCLLLGASHIGGKRPVAERSAQKSLPRTCRRADGLGDGGAHARAQRGGIARHAAEVGGQPALDAGAQVTRDDRCCALPFRSPPRRDRGRRWPGRSPC